MPKALVRLVADPISIKQIKTGDDISFDYTNGQTNGPSRVGNVIKSSVDKHYLIMWDYSLHYGPNYRSYKHKDIRNLARIQMLDKIGIGDRLSYYKDSIINFGRFLLGKHSSQGPMFNESRQH